MKKIIFVSIALVAVLIVIASTYGQTNNSQYLRIHIRADSNSQEDQSVKQLVRFAVVEYLTPCLATVSTKEEAQQAIGVRVHLIEQVVDKVLADNGFDYSSKVSVVKEQFPTRKYNDLTLSGGVYDALIIELGSARGDNWWCIVYPPLCFVGGEYNGTNSIIYRSKLLEIISQWQSN